MKILFNLMLVSILGILLSCTTDNVDPTKIGLENNCNLDNYTQAKKSRYVLPYKINTKHQMSVGNCIGFTHSVRCATNDSRCGDQRYAYDFKMGVGTPLVAVYDGTVVALEERYADVYSTGTQTNYLFIEHSDGTVASYLHLKRKGVLVEVGDNVKQGDVVALSGNSGWVGPSNPHLHFVLFDKFHSKCNGPIREGCVSKPITFKNSDPMDTPLRFAKVYTALPY